MLINKRIIIFTLFWSQLCFYSCKKQPTIYPEVNILSPYANKSFKVGDTVFVEAVVQSENLRKVELTMVNDNFLPVLASYNVPVSSENMQFTDAFIIDDLDLESGKYHIRVKAWNEFESASGYQAINVEGIPKIRRGINIATYDGVSTQVDFYPANGNKSILQLYAGDFLGMHNWSAKNATGIAPHFYGQLSIVDDYTLLPTYQENVPLAPGGAAAISGVGLVSKGFVFMNNDGSVNIKDRAGTTVANFILPNGYRGEEVVEIMNVWMLVAKKDGVGRKVFKYAANTHALLSEFPIANHELVYVTSYNNKLLMVEGKGNVKTLTISGSAGIIKNLANESIATAVNINTNEMALSLNDGLHILNLGTGSVQKLSGISTKPTYLSFDSVNQELFLSAGLLFEARSVVDWSLRSSLTTTKQILEHEAVYNR